MNQAELRHRVDGCREYTDPEITSAIRSTAAGIVEQAAKVHEGQKVLIWFDPPGVQLVKEMKNRCVAKGAQVSFFMRDLDEDARIVPGLTPEKIKQRFEEERRLMDEADVVLIVRGPENPEAMKNVPKEQKEIYEDTYADVHKHRVEGTVDWTLVYWPTEYEAKKEGLPYMEYFRNCMEGFRQPWAEIRAAQAILITEKLNPGKSLRLVAYDPDNDPQHQDPEKITDITMSIEGMTFANSTVDKNYPGSEMFSAPVMESVNGQIYASGEYQYKGFTMENIHLKVAHGRITEDSYAEVGNEALQTILANGEGARYFGEVALGSNPGLVRRFFNPLLNEKVGGSFHMALGHCYTMTEYSGEEVRLNNGNTEDRTSNHWDMTILMHRKPNGAGGGKVIIDGEVIQEDGMFLDPRLNILNPKLST